MADDNTLNDTAEVVTNVNAASNRFQELESMVKRLEKENAELKANADPATQQLLKGVCSNLRKMAKRKRTQEDDSDFSDIEQNDPEPEVRSLPPCYTDMQPQVKVDNVGPDISNDICTILNHCWRNPFRKEEVIEMLDAQVRPRNCDAVKPLEINSEVKLNKTDRTADKDLRYIGNAICGAGKCLAYLMHMFASAEISFRCDYPNDEGWLIIDDFRFDFPKCNKLLTSAMKLLGMANVQTGQGR